MKRFIKLINLLLVFPIVFAENYECENNEEIKTEVLEITTAQYSNQFMWVPIYEKKSTCANINVEPNDTLNIASWNNDIEKEFKKMATGSQYSYNSYDEKKFTETYTKDTTYSLYFTNTTINTIPAGVFSSMSIVTHLYLNKNGVKIIDIGAFNGLKSLTELHLEENEINTIEPGTFNGLFALEYLNISFNNMQNRMFFDNETTPQSEPLPDEPTLNTEPTLQINNTSVLHISADSFLGLETLKILDLSHNYLGYLEVDIFKHLQSLQTLFLTSNNFVKLHIDVFSPLYNLENLYLDNNELKLLDDRVLFPLRNLKELYINNNSLYRFKTTQLANRLKNLRFINLNDNFWNCGWLREKIYLFEDSEVTAVRGDSYNTRNVYGIRCFDYGFTDSDD